MVGKPSHVRQRSEDDDAVHKDCERSVEVAGDSDIDIVGSLGKVERLVFSRSAH